MRPLILPAVCALFACACSATSSAGKDPLKLAERVNLERYSGKWFEIARFPQWFQKDCASATAEYSQLPGGRIRVVNTCIRQDGTRRSVTGSAEPVDAAANRLRVRFSDSLAARLIPVPKKGNYWIIHVSPDYRQAIVGTPDRESLWFLSRSPEIPNETFARLKEIARAQGFDTSRLVVDRHTKLTGGAR